MGASASSLDQPLDGSNVYDRKRRNVLSLAALTGRTVAQCDTAAPPPPPPPVDPSSKALPPPPPDVAAEDSIAQAAAQASAYSNPGPYEQASMETKRLLQLDTFDGFRCDINKQVSPFMVAVHNFHLGTTTHAPQATNPQAPPPNSTYHFVTQVADEGGVFMTRVDFQRQGFDGRFQRMLGPGMVKFQGGVTAAGDGQTDQLLMEYDTGGMTWTANAKYGSMGGGLLYGMNYLQAVTPQLTMGAEGMFLSANNALLSNYTAKYTFRAPHTDASDLVATKASPPAGPPGAPSPPKSGASTICLNYHSGQQALTVGYQRVVTPQRVTVGAELQCSPFTLDSQILVGAEFQLLRSKLNVAVDGEGRLQSLLEARLGRAPNAPRLTFSADMDHAKSQMKFGYGLTVDSS